MYRWLERSDDDQITSFMMLMMISSYVMSLVHDDDDDTMMIMSWWCHMTAILHATAMRAQNCNTFAAVTDVDDVHAIVGMTLTEHVFSNILQYHRLAHCPIVPLSNVHIHVSYSFCSILVSFIPRNVLSFFLLSPVAGEWLGLVCIYSTTISYHKCGADNIKGLALDSCQMYYYSIHVIFRNRWIVIYAEIRSELNSNRVVIISFKR